MVNYPTVAKIVIFGSQGLLGYDLLQSLKGRHEIKALTRKKLDFSNTRDVARLLDSNDWDVVIDAAGLSDPEAAETEPGKAFALNAEVPGQIARLCRLRKIKFVYFSDALVFDGDSTRPYREDDECMPLSIFGHSKRNGELLVQKNNSNHLILRCSWLFGVKMKNIFRKICEIYESQEEMKVVEDYFGTPTWARDVGDALNLLLNKDSTGIYHISNAGICSWYDYTRRVLELNYPDDPLDRVVPIPGSAIKLKSKRPRNSALDTGKFFYEVGQELPPWENSLERYFNEVNLHD